VVSAPFSRPTLAVTSADRCMDYSIVEMPGADVAGAQPADAAHGAHRANTAAAPITALPIRAVPPLAARAARLVCNARTAQLLGHAAGVNEWQATVDVSPSQAHARFEQPGTLELAHPSGEIRVVFDLAAHPALEIAASPAGQGPAVPGDTARALRAAVAGVLLDPLLQRLASLGLTGVHVAQLVRGEPREAASAEVAAIDLTLTFDGRPYAARVLLGRALLDTLEALHATRGAALAAATRALASSSERSAGLAGSLIPGRLILGRRRLPVDTLRALAPGDVLLRSLAGTLRTVLARAGEGAREAATGIVAWGTPGLMRVHAPVSIDGLTLSITKEPTMTDELDPVRPDDLLAPDQHANAIEIGELDLPVQFEVDTVALPLSQLYALRPGYVLELPTPVADAQLKLVTHGQTIGYGELVTVGDHLGIRILRMAHGDGPVQ